MYSLTEEEKKDIIHLYGGSKKTIDTIEILINLAELNLSYDDYIYLVKECVSTHTSVLFINQNKDIRDKKKKSYMALGEVVKYCIEKYLEEIKLEEYDRYYDPNLFDEYPENYQK